MNVDQFKDHLQRIENGLKTHQSNEENEWLQTLSGQIYQALVPIAQKLGRSVDVDGKGELYETYIVGNEKAHLSKRLADGTVGEDGGTIKTFAESWEYKRLHWWKEALDSLKNPVILLDTPISKLAVDAHVSNMEEYFDPATVVKLYRLNLSGDSSQGIAMKQWVKDQITAVLNPVLKPDFEVKEYEQQLRICPKNEEALQSCMTDNATYEKAKKGLTTVLVNLKARFQKMEANIKNQ